MLSHRIWHIFACKRLSWLTKSTYKVQRTGGDSTEVALYKALGTIPRLKYLSLDLAVSDPFLFGEDQSDEVIHMLGDFDTGIGELLPVDPSFDDFDSDLCRYGMQERYRARNDHARKLWLIVPWIRSWSVQSFEELSRQKRIIAPWYRGWIFISTSQNAFVSSLHLAG